MMREILFRGIDEGTKEWVYGYYYESPAQFHKGKEYYIFDEKTISKYSVIPETVGQYTGITDKNGNKIFEGDIVKVESQLFGSPFWEVKVGKVVYEECSYFIEPKNPMESEYLFADECADFEIIDNIHDNPELLKGGEQE